MATKTITIEMMNRMIATAKRKAGVVDELKQIVSERSKHAEACAIFACGGQEVIDQAQAVQAQIDELHKQIPDVLRRKESREHCKKAYGHKIANIGGLAVYLDFGMDDSYPCPEEITIHGDHPLAQQFHDLEARERAAKERGKRIEYAVKAAVEAAGRSVKKLLQAWPEAAELLPKDEAQIVNLPVVQAAELNKLIGLPSGGASC